MTQGVKGELPVQGSTRGGEAVVENFTEDDYMIQVDVDLNSGEYADIWVRCVDAGNGYLVRLDWAGNVGLWRLNNGSATPLDSTTYTTGARTDRGTPYLFS